MSASAQARKSVVRKRQRAAIKNFLNFWFKINPPSIIIFCYLSRFLGLMLYVWVGHWWSIGGGTGGGVALVEARGTGRGRIVGFARDEDFAFGRVRQH